MRPQLWVFAGPNGAGKSTLVASRVKGRIPIVNPDELALTLPDAPGRELAAGKLAVLCREDLLARGESFGFETTLTGRTEVMFVRRAVEAGYKTNLIYVGLARVELSLSRVSTRVAKGGHNVPVQDIIRRFDRSRENLLRLLPLVDRTLIFDNSGEIRRLAALVDGGRVRRRADMPAWVDEALSA